MQKRLGKLERYVLDELTAGDMLVGFLCSSGSSYRMHKIAREQSRIRYQRARQIESAVMNLRKKGLVQVTPTKRGSMASLTKQGVIDACKSRTIRIMQTRNSQNNTQWDGQWRTVAFDIPMKMSGFRSDLRRLLISCGFEKLQQSVYVYPHPCPELQDYLSQRKELSGYVHLFTGAYDGDESGLRKLFSL